MNERRPDIEAMTDAEIIEALGGADTPLVKDVARRLAERDQLKEKNHKLDVYNTELFYENELFKAELAKVKEWPCEHIVKTSCGWTYSWDERTFPAHVNGLTVFCSICGARRPLTKPSTTK